MLKFKHLFLLLVLVPLGACASVERLAIPDRQLLASNLSQTGTQDSINHFAWDKFLDTYTQKDDQGVVRVDYASVSQSEHRALKTYIATLSSTDATVLSRDAQLAYWANLYNAATVNVILDHYPVDSIRDIKDGFLDIGPWEDKRLNINGRPTSLHDIEHGIVRPLWADTPEIHYILNCAAAGCPNLSQQAYTAQNVQALMRQAAIDFVNDPLRGVILQDDGQVIVSKIYAWYLEDFGGSQKSIFNQIKLYASPELKSVLDDRNSIHHYVYDWSLNDIRAKNTLLKPFMRAENTNP